jgi:hypothetical protein
MKLRIVEYQGRYYPQVRKFGIWRNICEIGGRFYLSQLTINYLWGCEDMATAFLFFEKYFKSDNKKTTIVWSGYEV